MQLSWHRTSNDGGKATRFCSKIAGFCRNTWGSSRTLPCGADSVLACTGIRGYGVSLTCTAGTVVAVWEGKVGSWRLLEAYLQEMFGLHAASVGAHGSHHVIQVAQQLLQVDRSRVSIG